MYGLPWEASHAARCSLKSAKTNFLTPCLNGCGVIISGTAAEPVVVHANTQAEALLTPFVEQQSKYFKLWSDTYVVLASKLVAKRLIPSEGLSLFVPTDYMVPGVAAATVFGVNEGGSWSFYATLNKAANGETRRIWPE